MRVALFLIPSLQSNKLRLRRPENGSIELATLKKHFIQCVIDRLARNVRFLSSGEMKLRNSTHQLLEKSGTGAIGSSYDVVK